MNFFNKLSSLLQGNKTLKQTKEDEEGPINIEQIIDKETNNTSILNSLPIFNSERGAFQENTEKDMKIPKVCYSIDTKEANSNINSSDDNEYKNTTDPNDKMEITIDKIELTEEDNRLKNWNPVDDNSDNLLDFETIIAVSKIKKHENNIVGIDQLAYDFNIINEAPNTNDLETSKTDLIDSNLKNINYFDNFEDFSVKLNTHHIGDNAIYNFNNMNINDTTDKKGFILEFTDEIKEFENIRDNYHQEVNTNDKDNKKSREVLEFLPSMDYNMSYKYKDEIEIIKLSKSNLTGDAISAIYSVSSNESDNNKILGQELFNACIISVSSTEVGLSDGIEATAQTNEIKKDPHLIDIEVSDSESDGYHSSDFEFITESDAEKDGLIINCFNKKQKPVNATKNSKERTLEISVALDSNNFAGPSTSRGSFYKTRHTPSATVTAETANNDFKAERSNNNVGASTSKGNFNKSHVQFAKDEKVTTNTANNHSKAYYNDLKMQFLMKESANKRETHSIPEGEDYVNLFREVSMPIWIDMENKYVTPPTCMALCDEDIGFVRRMQRPNSEERQFGKEADESVKKILEMYPEENRKRIRRF